MSENQGSYDGLAWIYFLRQLLISSAAWSGSFMMGLSTGSTTVLIPQMRKEANSTDAVSSEMASWLPAILGYSGIPWILMLPVLATLVGRKITHSFVCISMFVGYIIFYCSSDIQMVLISELFQGVSIGSVLTIFIVTIAEYTSSRYRGVFLTIKSATFFWGILVSNTIGTFFRWNNIPLVGMICSLYSLFTVFFWPESPFWLAKKGRFDQCAKAHRWLKGSDMDSEKELEKILAAHQNIRRKISLRTQIKQSFIVVVKKEFYKPVLLSMLLMALYSFSGKVVCVVYVIDIIKKMTNSESTAYTGMLLLDGVTLATMYVGCALAKSLKRRRFLLISSSIAVIFMLLLSIYLYLVKLTIITEDKYISISLLVGYSVAISCGPMILSTSISGELMPLESRSLSMCSIAFVSKMMYASFIKIAPYCFQTFGMHGTFLLFALSSSVCLVLLYLYLPETKDKTLQEIGECIKGVKPVEEAKELLPILTNNVIIFTNKNKTARE